MQTITTKSELDSYLLELGFEKLNSQEFIKVGKQISIIITPCLKVRVIKSKNCETLNYYQCNSPQQLSNLVLSYLN